ncbi:MAG: hypothetical protein FWG13_07830 [Leptospirales bacterium]|nr:hypothetical protein [Leptospirales bacterium]
MIDTIDNLLTDNDKYKDDFLLKGESLGISESELYIPSVSGTRCSINLHYLFSFYDGQLYCRCLDFDMYSRVNLESEVKEKGQLDNDSLARKLVGKVATNLTFNIIDWLITLRENKEEEFVWYSHEYYWKEYRIIREEMNNFDINKAFYGKEIGDFMDLTETIGEKLKDIESELKSKKIIEVSFQENSIGFFNKKLKERIDKLVA